MNKKKVGGCLLVSLIFLVMLPIVTGVWFWSNYVSPYQLFRIRESEAVPLYDALNEAMAQLLPPLPAGSSETSRWSVGITNPKYDHGRWLTISVSTSMTADEISAYYRQGLLAIGWNEYQVNAQASDLYFHNDGCLKLLLPNQYLNNYEIVIWHDYKSQPFSPPLPNLDYMQLAEFGETKFATCPP